jgi:hypothetical protein
MNVEVKLPSNKNFGLVFFIVFLLIGLWPLLEKSEVRYWSIFISLSFLILGLINSKFLNPLNRIWFMFGVQLGKIISPFVMGIIFFFLVAPIGVLMRFLGKDILNLKFNKNDKSYWIQKSVLKSKMKNQF